MSDSSFNTVIVRDSRIQDVSTKLDFKVAKGPAQSNYQQVQATSLSKTNINFNVVPPSENTIIDRNITVTVKQRIRLSVSEIEVDKYAMSYGNDSALNQFPFNSLCSNTSININQCSNNINTQDIMHVLLKMSDEEKLRKYNCPHMSDRRFKSYSDMVLSESNALGSFNQAKGDIIPRGSHPIEFSIIKTPNAAGANPAVLHTATEAQILAALKSAHIDDSWTIDITFETTEPILFMSPFLYGKENNNNAGLYGVRAMDFVFNLDSSAKRVFCTATAGMTISLEEIVSAHLNLNYLSCQASDLLSSKNVLPHCEYARHITSFNNDVAIAGTGDIVSQSIQFNQIPNRIYIVARKPMNAQTIQDSNSFLAITKISVNFNNVSGILAGATVDDLYNMSVANGSKQDFYEFLGEASYTNGIKKSTTGSVLVIDPSRDLNIPDYLSNGSIGQFSFQANITVKNTDVAILRPELLIIAEYNGLFITQSGMSTKQTGLLTTDLVVNSTTSQFGESNDYIKSFEHGNGANINSALKNIPLLNMSKPSGGAKSGSGYSGGAYSGGAYSGGAYSGGSQLRNLI
ncbi:unnamed protein product [Ectocarpus fasciculatus]